MKIGTISSSLFFTRHTHIPVFEKKCGVIYLNPGSPAMSKGSDVLGSIARLNDNVIEILDDASGKILMPERL